VSDPRYRERRRVDGTPASSMCDAGYRVPPFQTAIAYRSGDLIQCGPALIEKTNLRNIEVHSRNHVPRSTTDPMKSKSLRVLLALAVTLTFSALAQTGSAATPPSPSGAAANPIPGTPPATTGPSTGTKVGAINIQEAIFGSNEGRRDLEVLQKKFEPKQNELKSQNDELEGLKKQLTTQEGKLNEDALATLKKQIETKQKLFDRSVQDAQEDFGNQNQEIAGRILQKMAPMIVKYSEDNGFGIIVDTSKPWPQSNVLWWGQAIDITKAVVDAYNVQSGVAAPPAAGAGTTTPKAAPKAAPTKPATPKPTEPPK
jgi:Skp family chaperone for outer membrane proteins